MARSARGCAWLLSGLLAALLSAGCSVRRAAPAAPVPPPAPALIVLLPDPESGITGRIRVSNEFGSIGVTLRDDTRVSLGPNSEVKVDRYVYSPGEGGLGMVLKFVRGVAVYVSGRMAKIAPDSIRLEAPSAIVGVRGTTVAIRVGD